MRVRAHERVALQAVAPDAASRAAAYRAARALFASPAVLAP